MNKEVLHPTTESIERILSELAHKPYANHNERLPGTVQVHLEDLKEILLEYGIKAAHPPVMYFSNDGENFEFHKTREEAIIAAEGAIEEFQDKLEDGEGYDIYSDGSFHAVSYGLVLRSSTITVDDTVTKRHHAKGDYQQWPVGTEILRLGLSGLSEVKNPKFVLNAPAQVGNGVFREGVAWETVVNAAIRNYRHEQSKEKSKPIVSPKQLMQIALGELLLVPKTPSEAHLCSMAMRDRHDFGLLDDQIRASLLRDMAKLYEEATGQGFHKIGSAEDNTIYDGLGAKHSYFRHIERMDKLVIKISPEDADKLKADLTKNIEKGHFVIGLPPYEDPLEALSIALIQSLEIKQEVIK